MNRRGKASLYPHRCWWLSLLWLPALLLSAADAGKADVKKDLTELSLEDLMNLEVTSVSKKQQKLFRTAAAVFVLTSEDIRRSGMTNIADLLRLVPGMEVARISANSWAVSARGFNGQYAAKLLVLIDGRSIYSPLFGGVIWEILDLPLEDIERIEIIRGSGATMWGANAVNGVINVITKAARDTQGGMVSLGAGNDEQGFGTLRYGGRLGNSLTWRAHARHFRRFSAAVAPGSQDHWNSGQGGYRLDWNLTGRDTLTVQGSSQKGHLHRPASRVLLVPPYKEILDDGYPFRRTDVSSRWIRTLSETSEFSVQLNYEGVRREKVNLSDGTDTLGLDWQHQTLWGGRHGVIWGGEIRRVDSRTNGSFTVSFAPARFKEHLYAGFLQDDITLVPDKLVLTVGTKLLHNSYTGVEVQPGAQLLWTPSLTQTVWFSANRAVSLPSRADRHMTVHFAAFPAGPRQVTALRIEGNPQLGSERTLAREAGYRWQVRNNLSVDASAFYNTHANLATIEPRPPYMESLPAPPHLVAPMRFENMMSGESYGAELASNLVVTPTWRLNGSYTWFRASMHRMTGSLRADSELELEGRSPRHRFHIRSQWDVSPTLQLDSTLFRVGSLASPRLEGYTRLDGRLGWRPLAQIELDFVVQNMLDQRHVEFVSTDGLASLELGRSAYAKVTWRF